MTAARLAGFRGSLALLSLAAATRVAAWTPPKGVPGMDMPVPENNTPTPGRIALGEKLFFDTRLSKPKTMSCETCHLPEKGWTDGKKLSPKFDGSMNVRNTPT